MLPSLNVMHNLSEHLSNRGESKLEAFHDRFAHFANCGKRLSLADNLNLSRTARHNLLIPHAQTLTSQCENPLTKEARNKMSAAWEKVVPFFNHSELRHVNCLAKSVGCDHPFLAAEMLPPDKGECFFSQHVRETLPSLKSIKPGPLGECMCMTCTATTTATATRQEMELNNEANHEVNNNNTQIVFATATTATPTTKKTRKKQNNKQERQAAQCTVTNSVNCIVPAPACYPPVHHLPQLAPMQHQVPLCCVPQMPMLCCQKHAEWLRFCKWRPPHHPLCQNRQINCHKTTLKQTEHSYPNMCSCRQTVDISVGAAMVQLCWFGPFGDEDRTREREREGDRALNCSGKLEKWLKLFVMVCLFV